MMRGNRVREPAALATIGDKTKPQDILSPTLDKERGREDRKNGLENGFSYQNLFLLMNGS